MDCKKTLICLRKKMFLCIHPTLLFFPTYIETNFNSKFKKRIWTIKLLTTKISQRNIFPFILLVSKNEM